MAITYDQGWADYVYKTVIPIRRDDINKQDSQIQRVSRIVGIALTAIGSIFMYAGVYYFDSLGARSLCIIPATCAYLLLAAGICYMYARLGPFMETNQTLLKNLEQKDFNAACTALVTLKECHPWIFEGGKTRLNRSDKEIIYFLHLYANQHNCAEKDAIAKIVEDVGAANVPRDASPDVLPQLSWDFPS